MNVAEMERCFDGLLTVGSEVTTVSVRHASRYSLWVRFVGRRLHAAALDCSGLVLYVDRKKIEVGGCRIIREDGAMDGEYRLVPAHSIHDFEKLLFRAGVDMLGSAAVNLPLILSYKRRIDEAFVEFVSDLTYDLNAFRTVFDQIDANIRDEPPQVRALLEEKIIDSLGQQLLSYLDSQLQRLKEITGSFSEEQHEHHGFFFRKQLRDIIMSAPIMARTNLKPRGYIGDSQMMQMIYKNAFEGDTTFGKLMHKHAINRAGAQAVRNRRTDLARILRDFADTRQPHIAEASARLKVLSVACGPAMELVDIFQSADDCRKYHYSFLDQDRYALLEAASLVEEIEARLGAKISSDCIRESVRTMLVTRELQERWGHYDFIYSMGLFDYLTKPVAIKVLRKLYNLLLPGGEMIVGNFANENPSFFYMAYWLDWSIIYRTEEEMFSLAEGLPGSTVSLHRDATGIQIFLHIRKQC